MRLWRNKEPAAQRGGRKWEASELRFYGVFGDVFRSTHCGLVGDVFLSTHYSPLKHSDCPPTERRFPTVRLWNASEGETSPYLHSQNENVLCEYTGGCRYAG